MTSDHRPETVSRDFLLSISRERIPLGTVASSITNKCLCFSSNDEHLKFLSRTTSIVKNLDVLLIFLTNAISQKSHIRGILFLQVKLYCALLL